MPNLHACLAALAALASVTPPAIAQQSEIDKDLYEVTVPQLESLYAAHKYTVTQVVQWHLARIHRYNGVYRAVETIMEKDALVQAAQEDAEARLLFVIPVALVLIVILLYVNFRSGVDVLIVLSNVLVLCLGGIWALLLTNTNFSVSAAVGFISIFGVGIMDGLILVSSFHHLRLHGKQTAEWGRRAIALTASGSWARRMAEAQCAYGLGYAGRAEDAFALLAHYATEERGETGTAASTQLPSVRGWLHLLDGRLAAARADLSSVTSAALQFGILNTAAVQNARRRKCPRG